MQSSGALFANKSILIELSWTFRVGGKINKRGCDVANKGKRASFGLVVFRCFFESRFYVWNVVVIVRKLGRRFGYFVSL